MSQSRSEYLNDLSRKYGIHKDVVFALADVLGENEDHDGLITELDDLMCSGADDLFDFD